MTSLLPLSNQNEEPEIMLNMPARETFTNICFNITKVFPSLRMRHLFPRRKTTMKVLVTHLTIVNFIFKFVNVHLPFNSSCWIY